MMPGFAPSPAGGMRVSGCPGWGGVVPGTMMPGFAPSPAGGAATSVGAAVGAGVGVGVAVVRSTTGAACHVNSRQEPQLPAGSLVRAWTFHRVAFALIFNRTSAATRVVAVVPPEKSSPSVPG
jgi:hypothetical protein